jgi:hypothetical protein
VSFATGRCRDGENGSSDSDFVTGQMLVVNGGSAFW